MTARPLQIGEEVYLVPRTLGPPPAAWREPHGLVAGFRYMGEVTVLLDDGTKVTTHPDNVTRNRPRQRRPRRRAQQPRPTLADGYEEIPLW